MEREWKIFLIAIALLLSFVRLECSNIPLTDVTYDDIISLNATCDGSDSCETREGADNLKYRSCTCNRYCSLFGTCCVDSKHRYEYPKPLKHLHCDSIFQNEHFIYVPMIYGCDPDVKSNKTTKELCNSIGELHNDPYLNVPVTDPVTGISYKNSYCYACNVNYGGSEPIPWNLGLESHSEKINGSVFNLHFDVSRWKWIMDDDQPNATDVSLHISIPEDVIEYIPYCLNSKIISDCASNWTDNNVRNKCLAYMALMRIPFWRDEGDYLTYYRNPHCAICNYKSVDNRDCNGWDDNHTVSYGNNDFFYGLFSLHDKTSKCGDNEVYDYFGKKCRKFYRAKRRQ